MFGAFRQHEPARRAGREVAIGDALQRRPGGRHADDAIARAGQHRRLPGAVDDKEIFGTVRRHVAPEQRQRAGGGDAWVRHRIGNHQVGGHRVANQRQSTIGAGQRAGERHNLADYRQQRLRAARQIGDAARHRLGVAPMSSKVEGHGDIAVARQRQRDGLHELLRTSKAMCDDDDRTRLLAGPRHKLWTKDGGRNRTDACRRDGDIGKLASQSPKAGEHCDQGQKCTRRQQFMPVEGGGEFAHRSVAHSLMKPRAWRSARWINKHFNMTSSLYISFCCQSLFTPAQ